MKQFTKEELEALKKHTDGRCKYIAVCTVVSDLASALLEAQEGIWSGAPEWASVMLRYFKKEEGDPLDAREGAMQKHTRELTKTRARIIAEEEFEKTPWYKGSGVSLAEKEMMIKSYESAILKREAELKEGK